MLLLEIIGNEPDSGFSVWVLLYFDDLAPFGLGIIFCEDLGQPFTDLVEILPEIGGLSVPGQKLLHLGDHCGYFLGIHG